eukprot:10994811-Alexandrium_andersonii.AAC.1
MCLGTTTLLAHKVGTCARSHVCRITCENVRVHSDAQLLSSRFHCATTGSAYLHRAAVAERTHDWMCCRLHLAYSGGDTHREHHVCVVTDLTVASVLGMGMLLRGGLGGGTLGVQ